MVDRIIRDIRGALEHDLYFAALNSALTLPDICGKAAYPNERNSGKRYKDWYNEHIGKYEQAPNRDNQDNQENMPYLSGDVIYSLRCSMLHAGEPNVNGESARRKPDIDFFSLCIEKAQPFNIYVDSGGILTIEDKKIRTYRMSVRRICMIMCNVAESYYRDNKEKFHFDYEIIDWDEVTAKLPPIDTEAILEEMVNPNLGKEKQ